MEDFKMLHLTKEQIREASTSTLKDWNQNFDLAFSHRSKAELQQQLINKMKEVEKTNSLTIKTEGMKKEKIKKDESLKKGVKTTFSRGEESQEKTPIEIKKFLDEKIEEIIENPEKGKKLRIKLISILGEEMEYEVMTPHQVIDIKELMGVEEKEGESEKAKKEKKGRGIEKTKNKKLQTTIVLSVKQQAIVDNKELKISDKIRQLHDAGLEIKKMYRVLDVNYRFCFGTIRAYNKKK